MKTDKLIKKNKSFKKNFVYNELNNEIDDLLITQNKKPKQYKKISRKKEGQKSINYFTLETQEAIIKYQELSDNEEKNKIYTTVIHPAFDSLVENLINVYGFSVIHETRNDLKSECLDFLYRTLPKFNKGVGSLAFSYFNVVAKHWLTIRSKTNAKKVQSYISIDDKDNISNHDLNTIENFSIVPAGDDLYFMKDFTKEIKKIVLQMDKAVKSENEKKCIKAIALLTDELDDVDFLNKRAVLLYLREITGLNSKQLSVVLASLKKTYKEIKRKEENEIS